MKDLEYPRFMCRPGTAWELESGRFDVRTVVTADEAEAAHAEGWRFSQYDHGAEPNDKPAEEPAATPAPAEQASAPRRRKVSQ